MGCGFCGSGYVYRVVGLPRLARQEAVIPYTRHTVTPHDEMAVLAVLRSASLAQGQEVFAFEQELASLAGCRYAVAVSSGSAALYCAYRTLEKQTVVIPAITFMATAHAAILAGHQVVFSDVTATGHLKPGQFAPCVPVTMGGQPAPRQETAVLLDACHGPIHLPPWVGMACLSFHPAKHIAGGEGGAVLTNDAKTAERVRMLRDHGRVHGRGMIASLNLRMDELTAGLCRSQLTRYGWSVSRRHEIARQYDTAFEHLETVCPIPHTEHSARHLYQVRVPDGMTFRADLAERGIGTQTHYSPVSDEPYYKEWFGESSGFPEAERWSRTVVSLPLFPTMTEDEVEAVIQAVWEVA